MRLERAVCHLGMVALMSQPIRVRGYVMDPNTALEEIRAALLVLDGIALGDAPRWSEDDRERLRAADSLVEHVQALDEWLSRGGFLPSPWGKFWRGVRS